jgi:hypothetical protein
MTIDTRVGIVGQRFATDGAPDQWQWLDYSASVHDCRRNARAHHDEQSREPDYEPIDWAIKLDDGSIITAYLA